MKEYYVEGGSVWFLVGVTYISIEVHVYQQIVRALQKGPISVIALGPNEETLALALRADRKAALPVTVQPRTERDTHLEELLLPVVEEMPPLWGVRLMGVSVRKDENGNVEVLTPAGWEKR